MQNNFFECKAQDLRRILEKEREQAIQIGDVALVFAVGVLLGTVIDYLHNKFLSGTSAVYLVIFPKMTT